MSEDINSKIKVFYDDNEITDVIRTERGRCFRYNNFMVEEKLTKHQVFKL